MQLKPSSAHRLAATSSQPSVLTKVLYLASKTCFIGHPSSSSYSAFLSCFVSFCCLSIFCCIKRLCLFFHFKTPNYRNPCTTSVLLWHQPLPLISVTSSSSVEFSLERLYTVSLTPGSGALNQHKASLSSSSKPRLSWEMHSVAASLLGLVLLTHFADAGHYRSPTSTSPVRVLQRKILTAMLLRQRPYLHCLPGYHFCKAPYRYVRPLNSNCGP